ncbi:hypothetical protein EAE96_011110 [Botrytis aclada]|nr:hypothetical protein EAE96_011110 [Botrytis aclada]
MQYSFTALTLAFLATAIHASPIQLETRDIMAIADPNAANTTAPAPVPRDLTSFSITDTPQANTTSSANATTITATVTDPTTNTTGTVFPGTAANCTTFFIVSMGDTCDVVDAKNGITLDTLRSLNTEIDAGCANLSVGQALCVKA